VISLLDLLDQILLFCGSIKICQKNFSRKMEFRKVDPLIPGVDVTITIFGDFCQFSAKNWRFSQTPML
jgi:hypothetical protein